MGIAIQASFGKDTKPLNGLEAIIQELLDKPLQEQYVICKVRNARTSIDHENGDVETPTIKFTHIEPMLSDKEEAAAKKLFEAACKARLGDLPQQTLFEDHKKPDSDGAGEDGEQ